MRKSVTLGLAVLALGIVWVFVHRDSLSSPFTPEDVPHPKRSEAALYQVSVKLTQTEQGREPTLVFKLAGDMQQSIIDEGTYLSTWTSIEDLQIMGQSGDTDALKNRAVTSTFNAGENRYRHSIATDLPEALRQLQANIIAKILLPVAPGAQVSLSGQRQEKDDLGLATISYATQSEKGLSIVEKRWLSYEGKSIAIEANAQTFRYTLAPDGRLIQLQGQLGLIYGEQQHLRYLTEISVTLKSTAPAPKGLALDKLKPVATSVDDPKPIEPEMNFVESIEKLESITAESTGSEVYQVFSNLKQNIILHPEQGQEIVQRILTTTSRDATHKRQLTILFGALAQSESPQHADLLADLAQQCPDSFCRVQALVGASDHKFPNDAAAERVMDIAKQSTDAEVQGTAWLAAGAMGRKLASGLPQLPQILLSEINDPTVADQKSAIIAAMGNHGKAEYLPTLESYTKASDLNQRLAAVYSLRHVPGADGFLLEMIKPDQDKNVMGEAYKALAYRDLNQGQYQMLAEKSLVIADQDLQLSAARALVRAAETHPSEAQGALESFKNQTRYAAVQEYIKAETAPAQP